MSRNHSFRQRDLHANLPRRVSASELVATDLPPRRTILDPILSTNSLALLYGPRGLGKTFVALGIAWAASAGGSFLGWRASRPHRVLYIDGEMAATDMKERLRLMGPAPPGLEFMLADLQDGPSPDLGYFEGLARLMQSWGRPELVVFDNLSSLAGFKSGDPDCWSDLQRFLVMQRRFGRAVLLVHHANKKGEQRGTNRREDVLDLVMSLRRPADWQARDGAHFEIHFEKTRGLYGGATEPIEVRLVTDPLGLARWDRRPTQARDLDRVVTLLRDGLTPYRVARELGLPESTAYRLRRRAIARGLIERPKGAKA